MVTGRCERTSRGFEVHQASATAATEARRLSGTNAGCDEHNLVHSERFRVYKLAIWVF